jgi:hypothetical protein
MSAQPCPHAHDEMAPCYLVDGEAASLLVGSSGFERRQRVCFGCGLSVSTIEARVSGLPGSFAAEARSGIGGDEGGR